MPGIVGVFSGKGASSCPLLVERMIGSMNHEPFYVSSSFSFPKSALYCGFVGMKPASSYAEENGVSVFMTGNAYFEAFAGMPGGKSDPAHQVLDCYLRSSERQMLKSITGTFVGLLIDHRSGHSILFNDRYGFDRLYVCEAGGNVYFASEAKAICAVIPEARRFDESGLVQYLALGSTILGRSLYQGVSILAGGSAWSWQGETLQKKRYFEPAEWEDQDTLSPEEFQAEFEESLARVVPRYAQGSSPIGIALTGGLDTRMVMATLPTLPHKPVCYTYTSADREIRDARTARKVAHAAGFQHSNIRIENDFFDSFGTFADKTIFVTDGYFGVTGAHEVYLNAKGREFSPVRLTGVFGGEAMCDVSTFKPLGLDPKLISPDLLGAMNDVVKEFKQRNRHPLTFAAFEEIPWNIYGTIAACKSQVEFRTPFLDDNLIRLFYRMPGHPFDSRKSVADLIRKMSPSLFAIPTDMGLLGEMTPLSRAASRAWAKITFKLDYYANEGMPDWLCQSDPLIEKIGFGSGLFGQHKFLHYRRWFRSALSGFIRERLSDSSVSGNPLWNQKVVGRMAEEHISGKRNWQKEINAVLTIAAVERLLLKNPGRPASSKVESATCAG